MTSEAADWRVRRGPGMRRGPWDEMFLKEPALPVEPATPWGMLMTVTELWPGLQKVWMSSVGNGI